MITNEYDLRQTLRKIGNALINLADDRMTRSEVMTLLDATTQLVANVKNYSPFIPVMLNRSARTIEELTGIKTYEEATDSAMWEQCLCGNSYKRGLMCSRCYGVK